MDRFSSNVSKPPGVISEHLTRILKQYEMSAINSLRGPAAMGLPNGSFRSPNLATLREQSLQYGGQQVQQGHQKKHTSSVFADKTSTAATLLPPGPPPLSSDLLGVLAAVSNALRPPPAATATLPFALTSLGLDSTPERRCKTLLEGEWISCFDVGGEKRLCLPQILTLVLRDYTLQQINEACADLHIHCSQCTRAQLEALKVSGVLPMNAVNCGLITKTDSERLTNYLLQTRREAKRAHNQLSDLKSRPKPTVVLAPATTPRDDDQQLSSPSTCSTASTSTAASPTSSVSTCSAPTTTATSARADDADAAVAVTTSPKHEADGDDGGGKDAVAAASAAEDDDDDNLPVYHECFGRCRGVFKRRLYANAASECVECQECGVLLAPYRFVLHSHRRHETRTCHWGFDSANWRAYVHVGGPTADDQSRQRLERLLDETKAKFSNVGASGQKRSLSLDAKTGTLLPEPIEKRSRPNDYDASGVLSGVGAFVAPPTPLQMYDQLLIYQALLTAQRFGLVAAATTTTTPQTPASAPAGLPPALFKYGGATTKYPTASLSKAAAMPPSTDAAAVEEAAAALLKLAPQIAAVGGLNAQPALESFKSKFASMIGKDFGDMASGVVESSQQAAVGGSSCIEPLKKHILHRSMFKPVPHSPTDGSETPVMVKNGTQFCPMTSALTHCSDRTTKATTTSDSSDSLDSLLERYVTDKEALRLIRAKLCEMRRHMDGRLDSLTSQNRILQREIAYLRNKQVGGALCGSSAAHTAAVL